MSLESFAKLKQWKGRQKSRKKERQEGRQKASKQANNDAEHAFLQDGNHLVSSGRAALSNGGAPARAFGSNRWSATDESVEGVNGCSKGEGEEADPSGDEGPTFSLHSQEGDTEAVIMVTSFMFSRLQSIGGSS